MILTDLLKQTMAKLTIITKDYKIVLRRAFESDPSAFYVGQECRAVTGGRLTATVNDGEVTISSNRFSENELREIFASFLPEASEK